MSDTRLDVILDRIAEEAEARKLAKYIYCHRYCGCHDEDCPHYDADQEDWNYENCSEMEGAEE